jgi:hypothetical protein
MLFGSGDGRSNASNGSSLTVLELWEELVVSSEAAGGPIPGPSRRHSHNSLPGLDGAKSDIKNLTRSLSYRPDRLLMALLMWMPIFQPNAWYHLPVDALGLALLLLDAVVIPLECAWESSTTALRFVGFLAASYWSMSILFAMNTGFFDKDGKIIRSRKAICYNYFRTWFFFDLIMSCADWLRVLESFKAQEDSNQNAIMEAIRISRLLRLVKNAHLQRRFYEMWTSRGRAWVIVAFVIFKTIVAVALAMHTVACMWYLVGRRGFEERRANWLESNELVDKSALHQYLIAFYWALAHISQAKTQISAVSTGEQAFSVLTVLIALLIMGFGITRLLACISELRKMFAERSEARRGLREYLVANEVPYELATRTMRFLDCALRNRSLALPDPPALKMLSEQLRLELEAVRRKPCINRHPLFSWLCDNYLDMELGLCQALKRRMHAQDELIFQEGVVAQGMTFTIRGSFRLRSKASAFDTQPWEFGTQECFSELSLYTKWIHRSTLMACTYSDSFVLLLTDFITCIKSSPAVMSTVHEYARAFLELFAHNSIGNDPHCVDDYLPSHIGEKAKRTITVGKDAMPAHLQRQMYFFEYVDNMSDSSAREPTAKSISAFIQKAMAANAWRLNSHDLPVRASEESQSLTLSYKDTGSRSTSLHAAPSVPQHSPTPSPSPSGVSNISGVTPSPSGVSGWPGSGSWESILEEHIPNTLPELHPITGTYSRLSAQGADERKRATTTILNSFFLLVNSYDDFVYCQEESVRMSPELWNEFQEVVDWADMTQEMIHVALVFFTLRGLGKITPFVEMCPPDCLGSAERAIIYAMEELQESVPSVKTLNSDMKELLTDTFKLHELFNFAQMLQGENIPWSIKYLQDHIKEHGDQALRFYLFCLVAMMSGLFVDRSKRGSKFMTEANGRNVLLAIKSLQRLHSASPEDIYWEYIAKRAEHLNLPTECEDDIALARFACLLRCSKPADVEPVRDAWYGLDPDVRIHLVKHLCADGLSGQTAVLTFLPLYFANARGNPQVGLHLALDVLSEILELLYAAFGREYQKENVLRVNLADLAEFARQVGDSHVFAVSADFVELFDSGESSLKLQMSQKNWGKVQEQKSVEDAVLVMSRRVKDVQQKVVENNAFVLQRSSLERHLDLS